MLEAKAKDQGHKGKCSQKKIFFSGDFQKLKKSLKKKFWNSDLGSLLMNGSKLELSKEARLLGVTLDS